MYRAFSLLILSPMFFLESVLADPVRITGSITGAVGMKAELVTTLDFISNTEKIIASSAIGQDGMFELSADLKNTSLCYLKIGVQKAEIILEPGRSYNIRIKGLLDKSLRNQDIPPFQVPALYIEILNPWRFELNDLVNQFYLFHDQFMEKNSVALLRARDKKIVETYIAEVYNRFPGINNAWFNDLLTYKIAQVEMMARNRGRESMAEIYLKDKEILYYHPVFMDFFTQFFEKYIYTVRLYNPARLVELAESGNTYQLLMKEFEKDPVLRNESLRELVLISSAADLLTLTGMSRNSVINLLNYIQANSKYPEHRVIAGNLSNVLLRR